MKPKSTVSVKTVCSARVLVAALAAGPLFLAPVPARAADPGGGSAPAGKSAAVKLEAMTGTTAKRVILAAKAAERLGIETAKVGEQTVVRRQMVSGVVIAPVEKSDAPPKPSVGMGTFGGFGSRAAASAPPPGPSPAKAVAAGDAWVLVTLSQGEWERLAKDKPARVLPLTTGGKMVKGVTVTPSGMPPDEDIKRSMMRLYYVAPKDHGLSLNERTRVELQLAGSEASQKVVPYSAVYYDAKGNAWVYVNPKPLVFERQRVVVERVEGDLALLTEGPPVGTSVVSVGAALLYGAEIFGK